MLKRMPAAWRVTVYADSSPWFSGGAAAEPVAETNSASVASLAALSARFLGFFNASI